ncbi:MAG: bifunctional diaminohydroxyphosphoribosylaminopyrimidine deaminase/5-amino-6-(5-phosphoribosylamino)uracil reductase RibD [Acidobacteriota bacterium]
MTSPGRDDARHLALALALARRGHPFTSPNPLVGAVVVKDGRVVGTGFHARAGAPHAECPALREAADAARGATLYVNLEPCCHQGRTPPCTRAIIAAGIARVVACHEDPNPLVNGQGFAELRAARIEVVAGGLAREAARLNAVYLRAVRTRRPFGVLKTAQTLDGRSATPSGESKWITSPWSRALARSLRGEHDATAVGIGTVISDDPRLLPGAAAAGEAPRHVRVVFDSKLSLPEGSAIVSGAASTPVLAIATDAAEAKAERALAARGVEVLRVGAGADGRVDLGRAAAELFDRGIQSVFYEGGGTLAAALLKAGLIDRLLVFAAPALLGGRDGTPAVGGPAAERIDALLRLPPPVARRVGTDVLIEIDVFGVEALLEGGAS